MFRPRTDAVFVRFIEINLARNQIKVKRLIPKEGTQVQGGGGAAPALRMSRKKGLFKTSA